MMIGDCLQLPRGTLYNRLLVFINNGIIHVLRYVHIYVLYVYRILVGQPPGLFVYCYLKALAVAQIVQCRMIWGVANPELGSS
jgi:hypothetical protein